MSPNIIIQPVTYHDVRKLANINVQAMSSDRQTQLKCLGNVPYTTVSGNVRNMLHDLKHPKFVHVKAVDPSTSEILGYIGVWYVGFDPGDIPRTDPAAGWEGNLDDLVEQSKQDDSPVNPTAKDEHATKLIDSLDALESADMERWQKILMPEGSKCIVITGLQVAPAAQGKGVGTALLKSVTDDADRHGVYMWVHSSEGAYRVYQKSGFETVGTLDVDLDSYAPAPPPEGGRWGGYVVRYMKRLPVRERAPKYVVDGCIESITIMGID